VFDLETLLARVAGEAAERARADAVAVRVERDGTEDAVASFGPHAAQPLLEHVPVPPQAQPFRALTVSWTQGHGPGDYRSALVVPIIEHETGSGLLVACSTQVDAFTSAHVEELEGLARDLATSLGNARRFARMAQRAGVENGPSPAHAREM
jgi:GAF domain-containing protein